MPRKAEIEIVGDAQSYVRSLRQSASATTTFQRDLRELSVTTESTTRKTLEASLQRQTRLKEEALSYRALASSYVRGSREQVEALRLATVAEERYQRVAGIGVFGAAGRGGKERGKLLSEERAAGRFSKGAFEGGGLLGGLKFAALASTPFLAGYVGTTGLRTVIEAGTEAAATQRQLARQIQANGGVFDTYSGQIDRTNAHLSALSGFTKDDLDASLVLLLRSTGDVNAGLRLNAVAADVARGRHIGLTQAAVALGKAYYGQSTALRRLGVDVPAGVKGMEAINIVAAKFAGQARAGSTAQQRFSAELHNSEVIIGTALLPAITRLASHAAAYLAKLNRTGQLQRDVNRVLHDGATAAHLLRDGFHVVQAVLGPVNRALGGMENTIKLLTASFVAFKLKGAAAFVLGMREIAAAEATGAAGAGAAGGAGAVAEATGIGLGTAASIYAAPIVAAGLFSTPYGTQVGTTLPGGKGVPVYKQAGKSYVTSPRGGRQEYKGHVYAAASEPSPPSDPIRRGIDFPRRQFVDSASPDPKKKLGPIYKFELPQRLELEAAKALTKKDDLRVAHDELAYVEKLIGSGRLQGQALTVAYQERRQLYDTITGAEQDAAKKVTDANKKHKSAIKKVQEKARKAAETYTTPLLLQLAAAQASATPGEADDKLAAARIKAAALKAIRSGKLSIQAKIDAYNTIASVDSKIASDASQSKAAIGTYHAVSSGAFVKGLNFASLDDKKLAEERYAQASGHRFHAPSGPSALGQPATVHIENLHIDGMSLRNIDQIAYEIQKRARSKTQRAGTRQ